MEEASQVLGTILLFHYTNLSLVGDGASVRAQDSLSENKVLFDIFHSSNYGISEISIMMLIV